MKTPIVVAVALAFSATLAMAADDKKPAADKTKAQQAQKTHNKNSASDRQAAKQVVATGGAATAALGADHPATRDWAAIDTNKDNPISPEEMQKHLQEQWAAAKK